MKYEVNKKETLYFAIMTTISMFIYSLFLISMDCFMLLIGYTPFIVLLLIFFMVSRLYFIGHIKGNAIKVSEKQLPEIYAILKDFSQKLELKIVPDLYILQGNGVLNAFATKFVGKNTIILYSNIVEAAYHDDSLAIQFIIGHELGHIARNHVSFFKKLLIFPAKLLPFLGLPYSRACEYTCDNIGYALAPEGAIKGLLILAAGNQLYKKIDLEEICNNAKIKPDFSVKLGERSSSHPSLIKRINAIAEKELVKNINQSYEHLKHQSAV